MNSALVATHSVLRYLVLIFLVIAVISAIAGWAGKKMYNSAHNRIAIFALITCHIQLLIGLMIYLLEDRLAAFSDMSTTMKVPALRFQAVEHPLMMLLAIALITIGRSTSKKQVTDTGKFSRIAIFYGIGLIIILVMIPWPFMKEFGSWI